MDNDGTSNLKDLNQEGNNNQKLSNQDNGSAPNFKYNLN